MELKLKYSCFRNFNVLEITFETFCHLASPYTFIIVLRYVQNDILSFISYNRKLEKNFKLLRFQNVTLENFETFKFRLRTLCNLGFWNFELWTFETLKLSNSGLGNPSPSSEPEAVTLPLWAETEFEPGEADPCHQTTQTHSTTPPVQPPPYTLNTQLGRARLNTSSR